MPSNADSSAATKANAQETLNSWLTNLEWLCLALVGICQTFFASSIEKLVSPPNAALSCLGLALLAALPKISWFYRSAGKTFALIAAELLVVSFAAPFGVPKLFDVLYMIIIARAGLLLDTRLTLAALALAMATHFGAKELRYWLTERYIYALTPAQHILHIIIFGRLGNFALGMGLSAICTIAVSQERSLRLKRKAMNDKVAELSATLERTRLAREIHDSAGHIMTSMCMHLDVALALLTKKPEKAMQSLTLSRTLITQLQSELEKLSLAIVADRSLEELLQELADQYNQEAIFRLHCQLDQVRLEGQASHDLYSMIKESLHNVKKYAKATDVWLHIESLPDSVTATIKDNGIGFDPQQVKATSFGLQGMRERAERNNGKVSITSAPAQGTVLTISMPQQEPPKPDHSKWQRPS